METVHDDYLTKRNSRITKICLAILVGMLLFAIMVVKPLPHNKYFVTNENGKYWGTNSIDTTEKGSIKFTNAREPYDFVVIYGTYTIEERK